MKNEFYKINLEKDRPIINILGEVCWGFSIDDFEKKIGAKKDVVEDLLRRLLRDEEQGIKQTKINNIELEIIKKSLNEVEKEIEEWEFETRFGVTLEEVKKISILNLK